MAAPGATAIDRISAGVGSLVVFYTQETPEASDFIEVERQEGVEPAVVETTADETDHALVGLKDSTEYSIRVRGVSVVDGPGAWSAISTEFTAGALPSAPDFKRIYRHLLPRGTVFK